LVDGPLVKAAGVDSDLVEEGVVAAQAAALTSAIAVSSTLIGIVFFIVFLTLVDFFSLQTGSR
jgi:hypothetical protein